MELPDTQTMSCIALVLILLALAFLWYRQRNQKAPPKKTSCNLFKEPPPAEEPVAATTS